MDESKKISLSIIIPIYNEEFSVEPVVNNLKSQISKLPIEYEIIAVNDGSSDHTKEKLEKIRNIKIINHPYNKGYGSALKTGIAQSAYNWLLFFDADGQHKAEYIKDYINEIGQYDMISGYRQGYKGPIARQPGKKILNWIANYLVNKKIPDLNCGFRLVKKEILAKYEHILPSGFSFSTTSMLAFIKDDYNVKFVPVTINKRIGKSTVRLSDGFNSLMLIFRLIMLFSPLKIFLPLAFAGFFISFVWIIHDLLIYHFHLISKSSGFIFVASLLIFLFGLLADQIAAIRRQIK